MQKNYTGRRMTMRSMMKEFRGCSAIIRDVRRGQDGTVSDAVVVRVLSGSEELPDFPEGCMSISF